MIRCISHQRFLPSLARFPSTVLQHLPAGYSAAALLPPLLCRVQPIASQSMLSRHWLFKGLLRRTLLAFITLAFLWPLPTNILPDGSEEPPRTPTIVAANHFHEKGSNSYTQKLQSSRAQGTGRVRARASSKTRQGGVKTV